MKKNFKRIVSMLSTGLLILCTVVCLLAVVKATTGADPSILNYRCFYILTGSMEPTIPVNSVIIVHKQSTYEVGDVVTFLSNEGDIKGNANTHRIIEKRLEGNTEYFRTKGDANSLPDAEITADAIYGKMVFHTGRAKWFGNFLAYMVTPAGFLTIIGLPVILITIIAMKDYLKALRADISRQKASANQSSDDTQTSEALPEENSQKEKSKEKEEQR